MSFIKNMLKPPYTQEQLLSEVPVSKAIPLMSIPAVIGVLMILITTLTGTFYVGMLHSEPALAAVSVVYPITLLSATLAMIFGAGLAASIGRHLGAGELSKCSRLASTMFALCSTAAFVFVSLGVVFCDTLFKALGASEEVLLYARDYFIIQLIAIFFSACSQFLNYIASAESNMKLGAAAFIGSSLLHVLLSPLFMFAFGMGLRGVAVSSLVSQLAAAAILLTPYIRKKMLIELSARHILPQRGMVGEVVRSGLPLGVTQILTALSIALTNILGRTVLKASSVSFIAGYGVAVKTVVMVQYLLISYMIGFQAVAAYSYGSKNRDRFWAAYRHSRNVMLISDAVIAALFAAFSGQLIRMFSNDPEIIGYGSAMVTSMCLSLVISFPLPAVITCFQATGKGGIGAFVSSLRQGICYIPLVLILPRLFQAWGFYAVQPVSDIFTLTISLLLFARFKKRLSSELEKAQIAGPAAL